MFHKKDPIDASALARLRENVLKQRERFRERATAALSEGDTQESKRKPGQRMLRWSKHV